MATQQYYLKDKKIEIWKGEKKTVMGVNTWTYSKLYPSLWAYYRQLQGGSVLTTEMTLKVYDTTERAQFVINRIPSLRSETLSNLKVRFNGRVYDILQIDDYEGYKNDYKLVCEYSSTQSYNGMTDETTT